MADSANNLTENEALSLGALVLRTLYSCVVALALFAVLWTLLFPLAASELYRDLGNEARAYDCAQRAARISDGEERTNALISCISLGSGLFGENADYAQRLNADANAFLSDADCMTRTTRLDEYNLSTAPKSMHANLFSYEAFVRELKVRTGAHLGDYAPVQSAYTALATADIFESAALIGEIAAYYYQTSKDGRTVDCINPDDIVAAAANYFGRVAAGRTDRTEIENLYLVKQYEKLVARIALTDKAAADALTTVNYDGTQRTISVLYGELLEQYCN